MFICTERFDVCNCFLYFYPTCSSHWEGSGTSSFFLFVSYFLFFALRGCLCFIWSRNIRRTIPNSAAYEVIDLSYAITATIWYEYTVIYWFKNISLSLFIQSVKKLSLEADMFPHNPISLEDTSNPMSKHKFILSALHNLLTSRCRLCHWQK